MAFRNTSAWPGVNPACGDGHLHALLLEERHA
jgi:hypothetical protein